MPAVSKKTTVSLDETDKGSLEAIAAALKSSENESIRKALRLTLELIEHQQAGGEIILQKGRNRQGLRFLL